MDTYRKVCYIISFSYYYYDCYAFSEMLPLCWNAYMDYLFFLLSHYYSSSSILYKFAFFNRFLCYVRLSLCQTLSLSFQMEKSVRVCILTRLSIIVQCQVCVCASGEPENKSYNIHANRLMRRIIKYVSSSTNTFYWLNCALENFT